MNDLRKNLIFLRESMNLSRNKVDEYLKRKAGAIKRYEEGESEPNISTVVLLAKLYKVSIDDLVNKKFNQENIDKQSGYNLKDGSQNLDKMYELLDTTMKMNMQLIDKLGQK